MIIRTLEKKDESRWDRFVKESELSTFFHQIGWKNTVEKTSGYKSFYLFAEEDEEIIGVLPLFLTDGLIFGKRMVSMPYSPYGGCCARYQNIKDGLINQAIELSKEYKVRYLELRNRESILGMPTNNNHVTMVLNLIPGEESVWSNLRKGMKACINKAAKKDFHIILNSKNIKGFYSLYCRRMHELGTPVHSFLFFQNILENFPDMSVATIDCKGEILASQILLYFKKTVIYGWGASSNHYSEWHPVHSLLWKVIQECINKEYYYFDFGRSTQGSGTYDFKKWWGEDYQRRSYLVSCSKFVYFKRVRVLKRPGFRAYTFQEQ